MFTLPLSYLLSGFNLPQRAERVKKIPKNKNDGTFPKYSEKLINNNKF